MYFQAIGTIKGRLLKSNNKHLPYKLQLNNGKYFSRVINYNSFRKIENDYLNEEKFYLVYPSLLFIPKKPVKLIFNIVAWSDIDEWDGENNFTFRGIYQNIPQYKNSPVISVYRNKKTGKLVNHHIPVNWEKELVKPYTYKKQDDDLSKRFFVQVTARFIDGTFKVIAAIEEPTNEIPKYYKKKREKRAKVK